jgi:aminoglycoside phosphotransferase (APT) family kinase protein
VNEATVSPDHVLNQVPCLARAPRTVQDLPGGLTNRNYKVTAAGGVYVARVWSEGDLLAIDRGNEYHNSLAAARAGVSAPVVAYRPGQHLLVLKYIEARTLTSADVAAPAMIPRIAGAAAVTLRPPFDPTGARVRCTTASAAAAPPGGSSP